MRLRIPRPWIIPMLCVAGLVCGYLGGRLAKFSSSPARPTVAAKPVPARAPDATAALPAALHSQDSAETLLTLDEPTLYGCLALWLLDTGEPEISAFWQNYRQRKTPDHKITHLIFFHWTRVNPQAAVAAVGIEDDRPWRAWAINDPDAALAAAADSTHLQTVMNAIAEFHPKWLRTHFDQLPDASKTAAISALRSFADTSDPMTFLEFARKCGDEEMVGSAFRALATKDPLAAWDWIGQNPALVTQTFGGNGGAMEHLIQTMKPWQMKDLERLAALTPPGDLKRKIEAKIFEQLVTTDPEAALAEAKATKAPRIAAQRLAEVGKSFIDSNPEKAFETAAALFAICPGAADRPLLITYPGCERDTVEDGLSSETYRLLAGLSAKDPARTLEMILPGTPQPNESGMFSYLTNTWAQRDLPTYTGWVNQQTDPLVREPAARLIVSQLARKQQYGGALDWAMTLNAPQNSRPDSIYQNWNASHPQEAQAWLKSAKLPADRKALIEKGGSK